MQSNGGLTDAKFFQGKDALLSGPAGGVVSMVQTGKQAGYNKLIGFDMGGTSTDVCHFAGEYERSFETELAGVRIRAPMMQLILWQPAVDPSFPFRTEDSKLALKAQELFQAQHLMAKVVL